MHRQQFLQHIAQTSQSPLMLEIEHADGCWLFDANGKKYLDLISGIAVSNVGHNNAEVKTAIYNQVEKYMHVMVYGEFIESPQVKYAKWISNHLPAPLNSVYFVNSGSEAVEGALKLAKRVTGRPEIISFHNSYHGSTMGALSAGNNEERKNVFRPLIPDNTILNYNDFDQLELITENTAAVLIEPIQAEAGIILPEANYLEAIREKCNATGTLLIFDECQTGFGRTGKLFAWEHSNVIPDIITLGKALGGGMPLGAFVAAKVHMDMFTQNPILGHLTTFGGHPVCCAAGLAASEFIEKNNL
ncbi:MAG: aspartate aminotransferase family protein, partial [Chitinophagales bacterium]